MIHIKEQKVDLNLNSRYRVTQLLLRYIERSGLLLMFLRTRCIHISIIELSNCIYTFENCPLSFLMLSQRDQIQSLDNYYYLLKIPDSL